jgi:hypothetical protein
MASGILELKCVRMELSDKFHAPCPVIPVK